MRIDDLERLVEVHAKMIGSLTPFVKSDGDVGYYFNESRDAVQAIAKAIKLGMTTEGSIVKAAPEV